MSLTALRALALVWVVCCAALVYLSSEWLPDSVAANFGQGGKPTGFTARDTYRAIMSTFVFAIPLLVYAGIVWLPRAFPRFLWLPNRDYWLSSTRRGLALNGIERLGLLISCIVAVFAVTMHILIIRANSLSPPHFELWSRWALLVAWFAFIGAAVFVYHRRFRRAL